MSKWFEVFDLFFFEAIYMCFCSSDNSYLLQFPHGACLLMQRPAKKAVTRKEACKEISCCFLNIHS